MTVEAVVREVLRDRAFYRRSGGGVTLSGGEPTAQAEFARAVLAACRRHGLDTAVETCGYVAFPQLASLSEYCDLFLYDLKHMDSEAHQRLTGVPNELILENLQRLGCLGARILVRVPIIPEYNDAPENLTALAAFVAKMRFAPTIELLPYHNYGSAKYGHCHRPYLLGDLPSPSHERMRELAAGIAARGVLCQVG
jgi:pyruvate formate lyase activating enzyme